MNEDRKRALEAFDRLYRIEEATYMTVEQVIRLAAIATDYPEEALRAALIAETEAKG